MDPLARTRPRVVIVGGGFAGLTAARALGRAPVELLLLDRRNHHCFQPLLYQVATAGLSTTDIASPLRRIVAGQSNTTVLLAEVRAVDVERKLLELTDGRPVAYDTLLLAPGMRPDWFGHESDWAPHAPGLKECADALEIRRRILLAFERAEAEPDDAARAPWLSFVIVGGGPTGVELAGALAEIARETLTGNFRRFRPRDARIVLVESGPRLLAAFPSGLSADARARLEALGVEVHTGCRVVEVDAEGVTVRMTADAAPSPGPLRWPARTVVWAAGVSASPLLATLGAPLDRKGRVLVEPDLSLPGHPEVLVLGDAAARPDVPGLAPAAIQMGRHAARRVAARLAGDATRPAATAPFRYRDKGQLAAIGRRAAAAAIGRLRLTGRAGWLVWALVHIFFLIGFRNRFLVMFEWSWLYLTKQRGARVLLDGTPREGAPRDGG